MFSVFDLHDISAVFTIIRGNIKYQENAIVLKQILEVFANRSQCHSHNQIRASLKKVENLDNSLYFFVKTLNVYSYTPGFLKDERIYRVLVVAIKELLQLIENKQWRQAVDLADCLHNLPIDIADNKFLFPEKFWINEAAYYRKLWNPCFLKNEETLLGYRTELL